MIFTSYGSHTQRSSRTSYSIRREAGMRVDAIMGEADGEDDKVLLIQSLRAMVDGFKMQMATDQDLLETTKNEASLLARENAQLKSELARTKKTAVEVGDMQDLSGTAEQQILILAQENADLKRSLSDLTQSLKAAKETMEVRAEMSNDPLQKRPLIQEEDTSIYASPTKFRDAHPTYMSPSSQNLKNTTSPEREQADASLKEASMMLASEVNRLNEELKSVRMLEQGAATQAAAAQRQLDALRQQLAALQVCSLCLVFFVTSFC